MPVATSTSELGSGTRSVLRMSVLIAELVDGPWPAVGKFRKPVEIENAKYSNWVAGSSPIALSRSAAFESKPTAATNP